MVRKKKTAQKLEEIKIKKSKKKDSFFFSKFFLIFLIFILIFLIFVYKLYSLQVIGGEKYREIIDAQHSGSSLSNVFHRGSIFFKEGDERVRSAILAHGYILAISPKDILNPEYAYTELSSVLEINKEDFLKKADYEDDPYEEIADKITESEAEEIKKLNLSGVGLYNQTWREYPFGKTASKVLGFLTLNPETKKLEGSYGLEKFYEDILKRDQKIKTENIWKNIFNSGISPSEKKISREGSIYTTIDLEIQQFLEKILVDIDEKYSSQYSAGIIIKPYSGEIVAMSDSKNFDLNTERQDFRNVFVENVFEFGSIVKPLTIAIGLDSGFIDENFLYDDVGHLVIDGYTVSNYDKKGRGENVDLYKILANSLNTGVSTIAGEIPKNIFRNYITALGFNSETGVDLPEEVFGTTRTLDRDIDINFATASFGQGIAPTPISMIKALGTLAADGYSVEPYLVEEINYGKLIPKEVKEISREAVFNKKTTDKVKNILVDVADNALLGGIYYNENYAVGAKTGTAQIPDRVNGGYLEDEFLHSFFGFFPAYAPAEERYLILLYTTKPQYVRYASESLTSFFYELFDFIINYKKIKPDRISI